MEHISKEWLEFLRQQYPKGSRIRLREMGSDDPQPIQPGSMGTLEHIDDIGTFHVKWDDGRGLGLVIGQDSFTVLPPQTHELKTHKISGGDSAEEERFAPKLAEGLPELCFSTLLTSGDLICIKRGETGYYPSEWDTGDKEWNVELADELNERLGVTMWQRKAMEVGSMCGWDVPGADPAQYLENDDHQIGGMELG